MDITLEGMLQENLLIHQDYAYFSSFFPAYERPHNFQEACPHKDTEEIKVWLKSNRK